MRVESDKPVLAATLACTGEWIDVTSSADLYCTRGQHGFASGRTRGEEG